LDSNTLRGGDLIANYVTTAPDTKLWDRSNQNVLSRYGDLTHEFDLDPVVCIVFECPSIEPAREEVNAYCQSRLSGAWTNNARKRMFPHSSNVQIASRRAFEAIDAEARGPAERERVIPFQIARPNRFLATHVDAQCERRQRESKLLELTTVRNIY
jgi:spore coat polysaccharide biosynthesis protein SpsF (cytidylyltransferase family)